MPHAFEPLSGRILDAAVDVHRQLGPGYLEAIYAAALKVALARRRIAFEFRKQVRIFYESEEVGTHRVALIVGGQIVVEPRAIKELEPLHFAQVRSYLKATRLHVGLLLNFNAPTLVIKRIVL